MGGTQNDTGDLEYDPNDPEYVWNALGICIVDYEPNENMELEIFDGRWYFGVPSGLAEEYAAGDSVGEIENCF